METERMDLDAFEAQVKTAIAEYNRLPIPEAQAKWDALADAFPLGRPAVKVAQCLALTLLRKNADPERRKAGETALVCVFGLTEFAANAAPEDAGILTDRRMLAGYAILSAEKANIPASGRRLLADFIYRIFAQAYLGDPLLEDVDDDGFEIAPEDAATAALPPKPHRPPRARTGGANAAPRQMSRMERGMRRVRRK